MEHNALYKLAGREGAVQKPDLVAAENAEVYREPVPCKDSEPRLHGFTVHELLALAEEDERQELIDNRMALGAFALAMREAEQKARGIRPARFSTIAFCAGCGVVCIPPTWFIVGQHEDLDIPKVPGCPWCANRLEGKPRPKPYPLPPTHYDPNLYGPWPYSENCRPKSWQGIDERRPHHEVPNE